MTARRREGAVPRPHFLQVGPNAKIAHGDALEALRGIPDGSASLVLTDPPYNIGKAWWDKIPDYVGWCISWLKECERILADNGSLYFWHNDMGQVCELMVAIKRCTCFRFRQLCVWEKPNFRKANWHVCGKGNTLRNWFNISEYCLYYVKSPRPLDETGLTRINSNAECYRPLKEWYRQELERLGITEKDIAARYVEATGKKPYMLRHYFCDSQFEIPTRGVWEAVYMPLGFGMGYGELRKSYEGLRKSYEGLRKSYEGLRKSYEGLRPVHNLDAGHCNVWRSGQMKGCESSNKNHICEKPTDILERVIRTSSREGDTVLDCFMGSGSTGVACMNTGRKFIGIELDGGYFDIARERIRQAAASRG